MSRLGRVLTGTALVSVGALALPAWAATAQVAVGGSTGNFYFEDSTVGDGKVVVDQGDQIAFTFQGNLQHTATVDGLFSSGRKSGTTWTSPALLSAGSYTLYCSVHGRTKHSTTLVVRSTGTTAPGPTTSATPSPTKRAGTKGTPKPIATSTATTAATAAPTATRTFSGDTPAPTTSSATAQAAPAVPVVPGSLADALERAPAAQGSWHRAFWMALLLAVPLGLAAAWALRRSVPRPL